MAIGHTIHGLPSGEPNALPDMPAIVPRAPNMSAMPATYVVASATRSGFGVPALTPKMARVIGIIGNTQGVSPVRNP